MFAQFNPAGLTHFQSARAQGTAAETVLSPEDFSKAIAEITTWEGYTPTPLIHLSALAGELALKDILYKDEGPRFGLGSFKALGGAYAAGRVLQREIERETGHPVALSDIRAGKYRQQVSNFTLVTATDGNHGRSLAWGARRFGAACRIYIHREVSANRANAMQALDAEVVRIDGDYDQSVHLAREEDGKNRCFVVSDTSWEDYSDPPKDVMAGYGLITHEINQVLSEAPSHVLVQGGVGGLAAAICAGLRQRWGDQTPRMIVVEPDLADCLYSSARAGRINAVKISEETMMAGLSCGEPSPLAWEILREEVADFVTIPDSFVAPTMRLLGRPLGNDPAITAGESAVAGLAALIVLAGNREFRSALGLDETSTPLVIGTEGATDPSIYEQIMSAQE